MTFNEENQNRARPLSVILSRLRGGENRSENHPAARASGGHAALLRRIVFEFKVPSWTTYVDARGTRHIVVGHLSRDRRASRRRRAVAVDEGRRARLGRRAAGRGAAPRRVARV